MTSAAQALDRAAARRRLLGFALLAATAGGLLLAWSQTWFTLRLDSQTIAVPGRVAGGALVPLALVSLALILALALAGTGFRIALGVLEVLVGAGAITASGFALANPAVVATGSITTATGITGSKAVDLVVSTTSTGWPAVGIAAGVLGVVTGLYVAVTARAWPQGGRRFSRTRAEPADGVAGDDPVREWDALSEGDDPTRDP